MTTSNKPENQKTQGSLSDLGQISTEHAKAKPRQVCIRHGALRANGVTPGREHMAFAENPAADTQAAMEMALMLHYLTSTSKADREYAKSKIREWAKKGADK